MTCVRIGAVAAAAWIIPASLAAQAASIVALGASNTFGKGIARSEAFPAQLETLLRAKGFAVHVVNAGSNGDTTANMLRRLDGLLAGDTRVVILQPGGNDARKGQQSDRSANIAAVKQRLRTRGVKLVMVENAVLHGLSHQPDGSHLTPEGYRRLAEYLLPEVESGLTH